MFFFQGEKKSFQVNGKYQNIQNVIFVSSGYDTHGAKLGVSSSIFQAI